MWTTLIFLISSGEKSPNWISSIVRSGALEYAKLRFAIFAVTLCFLGIKVGLIDGGDKWIDRTANRPLRSSTG